MRQPKFTPKIQPWHRNLNSPLKQLQRQLLAVHVVLAGSVLDPDKASEVTEKFDLADDIG